MTGHFVLSADLIESKLPLSRRFRWWIIQRLLGGRACIANVSIRSEPTSTDHLDLEGDLKLTMHNVVIDSTNGCICFGCPDE